MDALQIRLACLIASSAILHAVALAPLQASRSPSRLPFSPLLTVDLAARDSPLIAPPVALATAPAEAPVAPSTVSSATGARPGDIAAAPNTETPKTSEAVRNVPRPQPPGNPLAGGSDPSPNAATQNKGGVRLALADEVSVRVQLLSYEGGQKPNETVTIQGKSYIYFKSPSLRQAALPLQDARPHYPADKPEYIHGAVMVQLLIDEEGKLEQMIVLCSNPKFENSAIASIQNMRFTPAQALSGPVKSYMIVEFGYGRGYPCSPVPD